ncbi:MAG: tetratricopeptide repeat protein [Pseudomonadales bacterium]
MILTILLFLGCQGLPPDDRAPDERLQAGETVAPSELREAFFEAPELSPRMRRLTDLESQALALIDDEPLKLGSIGSAILDTYYGSLAGHYVLARFYHHVSTPSAAALHEQWVKRIQEDIESAADGTAQRPLPAMTPVEARVYARTKGWTPLGAIYHSNDEIPFSLVLHLRKDENALQNVHFDLTGLFVSMREELVAAAVAAASDDASDDAGEDEASLREQFTPFTLIGLLARQNDSAAQTAIGAFLASHDRLDDAVRYLRDASRTGNLLANSLLARIHWEQARTAPDEAGREEALALVMDNYLHAIALGSADAMYALGVLYLNGHYGDDNKSSGVPLLIQADALGHSDATMFLAHLHYAGEVVERDLHAARRHYVRAAESGNSFARKSYARFLLDRDADQPGDPRAIEWLQELAEGGEAESMTLLGNLHARGVGTSPSTRRAVSWFKRAVRAAPHDPNIVNEVAWTLTVTDQRGLRRHAYARQIMDRMMEGNDEARARPEYLDTWAATYAANGNFERAVTLQEQALHVATEAERDDVMDILREHLEAFQAGETLSESVP